MHRSDNGPTAEQIATDVDSVLDALDGCGLDHNAGFIHNTEVGHPAAPWQPPSPDGEPHTPVHITLPVTHLPKP